MPTSIRPRRRQAGDSPRISECAWREQDLSILRLFHDLGVRVIQIAHNVRNLYGDGCAEAADAGLSTLGRELITEMNRLGIVIDISHAGNRTGLEAMEFSRHPVTVTHANAHGVCANARNKSDATLDALKKHGGVIGICYLTPMVRMDGVEPSHADLVAHIEYIRNAIGSAHIGIGSDFIAGIQRNGTRNFLRNRSCMASGHGASRLKTRLTSSAFSPHLRDWANGERDLRDR